VEEDGEREALISAGEGVGRRKAKGVEGLDSWEFIRKIYVRWEKLKLRRISASIS